MANVKHKQNKSSSRFPVKTTPRSKAEDHDDAEQSTASTEPIPQRAPANTKSSSRFPVKSHPRSKAEDYDDPSTAEQSTKPRTNSAPNIYAYARGTQASTAKQVGDGKRLSLALDTKASIAKSADGAGLGPPNKSHARTTSAAGQMEGAGSANPGSSGISRPPSILTRRNKGKGKQLEIPLTNSGTRRGGVSDKNAFRPYSGERRHSREGEVSLSECASASDGLGEEVERDMQDAELVRLDCEIAEFELEELKHKMRELERKKGRVDGALEDETQGLTVVKVENVVGSGEGESGLPADVQSEVEVHKSPKLQNPTELESDLPQVKVESAEIRQMNELQRSNQRLEDAVAKLAHRNQQLEDELVSTTESAIKQEEAALEEISALVSAAESAVRQEEIALIEVTALKENVQKLSQDLEAKNRELDEVKESTKTSGEKLTEMREDVEYLANAVKQTGTDDASKTKALRDLRWKPYSSLEAKDLHRHIIRFTTVMEGKIQAASAELECKNAELATAQNNLQVLEESKKYWKRQTEQAQKKNEQIERRLADWKVTAEAMYQPNLEEKNRVLQADLTTARDDYNTMHERMQAQKTRAQRWEAEFKTMQSRAEKESEGFELACEQQRKDMMVCMREYHEKLNDPRYFELEPLHEKVRALERELQVTTEEFDAVKVDKARMEEDVLPGILAQMREYEVEIEGLRDAWGRDGLRAAYAFDVKKGPSNDSREEKTSKYPVHGNSATATTRKGKHVPRCLHPKETARREAELKQLRQRQAKHRTSQDNFGTIMKRVHRWQMEENLWESQGWDYRSKTNSGWVSDVELDMETRTLIKGLREQGMIDG